MAKANKKRRDAIVRTKPASGHITRVHTWQEWRDLPIELIWWKGFDQTRIASAAGTLQHAFESELDANTDLSINQVNLMGEEGLASTMPVRVSIVTRQAYGTAENWDLIIRVLNITADILSVSAGSFAAGKLLLRLLRRTKAVLPDEGREFEVGSEAAAALLALAHIAASDPAAAEAMVAEEWEVVASNQSIYYVVTLFDYKTKASRVFIVELTGEVFECAPGSGST